MRGKQKVMPIRDLWWRGKEMTQKEMSPKSSAVAACATAKRFT